jgi:VWFA-related protein
VAAESAAPGFNVASTWPQIPDRCDGPLTSSPRKDREELVKVAQMSMNAGPLRSRRDGSTSLCVVPSSRQPRPLRRSLAVVVWLAFALAAATWGQTPPPSSPPAMPASPSAAPAPNAASPAPATPATAGPATPANPPAPVGASAAPLPSPGKLTRKQEKELYARLPQKYKDWLAEVDVLISAIEKNAFLILDKDYQRDAFIDRFWDVRDLAAGERGEYHRRFLERIEEAHQVWHDLTDERARVFLLNGPPNDEVQTRCATLMWPVDIWYYATSDQMHEPFVVIFYQHFGAGAYRVWDPLMGMGELMSDLNHEERGLNAIAMGCRDGDKIAGAIGWVSNQGMGYAMIQAKFESKPKPPGLEWISSFRSYSTDVPENAQLLPAKLDIAFPAHSGGRTVVEGLLTLPSSSVTPVQLADRRSYDFLVTGEILEKGRLFENFRYKFDFPVSNVEATLPLLFQRMLRPGQYTLIIKLEDLNAPRLFRTERKIVVPAVAEELPAALPTDEETAQVLKEANEAMVTGSSTVRLVPPRGELRTGMLRIDTVTTGAAIQRVNFALDGKQIFVKAKPPYIVEFDLGTLPRPHHLTATALDGEGKEVASDDLLLNASGQRFRVHILEPQRNKRYSNSLLAKVETEVPDGEAIDKVEMYLDETLMATLYQPPFTQAIVLPKDQAPTYLRAVAYTMDGASTEELVFINAPDNMEQLNVQYVELYASALDRRLRPVGGLTQKDFSIKEDGKPQEISRFEQVADQPFHVAVVLDTSASMEKALDTARDAALRFLEQALRPKDRAVVITFNDHPNIAVKFSNDVTMLAAGLAGLKAERSTALYDTLIFTMYYFTGVKGQRAILLLSDGRDEGSRFTYDDALESARRSGVTLYTVGLGDDVDKKKLTRMSEETGGRAFFIKNVAELDGIYKEVQEELRSQYLIAYQSNNTGNESTFRAIEVKSTHPGVEVKTLHGYYP